MNQSAVQKPVQNLCKKRGTAHFRSVFCSAVLVSLPLSLLLPLRTGESSDVALQPVDRRLTRHG